MAAKKKTPVGDTTRTERAKAHLERLEKASGKRLLVDLDTDGHEQGAGLGVPSIQIECDPDTGLLVGNVPGVPGAHTQGETVEELYANLTEVLETLQEHTAVAPKGSSGASP